MRCPYCNGRLIVQDTRKAGEEVLRRRRCLSCHRNTYTYESIDDTGYVKKMLNEIHARELAKSVSKRINGSGPVGGGTPR